MDNNLCPPETYLCATEAGAVQQSPTDWLATNASFHTAPFGQISFSLHIPRLTAAAIDYKEHLLPVRQAVANVTGLSAADVRIPVVASGTFEELLLSRPGVFLRVIVVCWPYAGVPTSGSSRRALRAFRSQSEGGSSEAITKARRMPDAQLSPTSVFAAANRTVDIVQRDLAYAIQQNAISRYLELQAGFSVSVAAAPVVTLPRDADVHSMWTDTVQTTMSTVHTPVPHGSFVPVSSATPIPAASASPSTAAVTSGSTTGESPAPAPEPGITLGALLGIVGGIIVVGLVCIGAMLYFTKPKQTNVHLLPASPARSEHQLGDSLDDDADEGDLEVEEVAGAAHDDQQQSPDAFHSHKRLKYPQSAVTAGAAPQTTTNAWKSASKSPLEPTPESGELPEVSPSPSLEQLQEVTPTEPATLDADAVTLQWQAPQTANPVTRSRNRTANLMSRARDTSYIIPPIDDDSGEELSGQGRAPMEET